jgi:hypothetical protein
MEGLQLWFDAADTNSLSLNGNSLVKWIDKSGSGSNATANAGVTWGQRSSGNGLPAVLFKNSQWLIGSTRISGNSFTAFCVFNMSAKSKDAARVLSLAAPNAPDYSNNGFIGMLRQPVNKFMNWRNSTRSDNSTIQLDAVQMSTSWVDGSTSNIAINGNNPATIPSSGNFAISSFALGCSTQLLDDTNAPLYGSICEVILFNTAINSSQRQQIEGYLAWKWGLQQQLPSSHPHKSATPEPIPSQPLCNTLYSSSSMFSPRTIGGLQLWYDGSDPAGNGSIPADGAAVSTWVNKAGLSIYNAIATSAATYSAAYNAIYFSGTNMYSTGYTGAPTEETMFIVYNNPSPNANTCTLIGGDTGARGFGVGYSGGGGGVGSVGMLSLNVQWNASSPAGSYTSGTTALASGIVNAGKTAVATNGGDGSVAGTNFTASTKTYLGGQVTPANTYMYKGYAMEIVVYNFVLSTTHRQQVEGYLAWKWGTQSLLPASHQYKSAAP